MTTPLPFVDHDAAARESHGAAAEEARLESERWDETIAEIDALREQQYAVADSVVRVVSEHEAVDKFVYDSNRKSQTVSPGTKVSTRRARKEQMTQPHGLVGFADRTSVLLPLGRVLPDAPEDEAYGYVEFEVKREVEPSKDQSQDMPEMRGFRETNPKSIRARIFTGGSGLDFRTDTDELQEAGSLVKFNDDLVTVLKPKKPGLDPYQELGYFDPNCAQRPDPADVPDAEILNQLGTQAQIEAAAAAAGKEVDEYERLILANPRIRIHLAQQFINAQMELPGAEVFLRTGNALQTVNQERDKLYNFTELLDLVDRQLTGGTPPPATP